MKNKAFIRDFTVLVGLSYFGFYQCYVLSTNAPFQFDRKCLKNDSKTIYLYLFGYILCLVCILITIFSYTIVALKLRFHKKIFINSAQIRQQRTETQLFYQGALIAMALLFEFFCSYVANFHRILAINRLFLVSIVLNSCVNPWILLIFNANVKHQVFKIFNWRQRRAPERRFSPSLTMERGFGSVRVESKEFISNRGFGSVRVENNGFISNHACETLL